MKKDERKEASCDEIYRDYIKRLRQWYGMGLGEEGDS